MLDDSHAAVPQPTAFIVVANDVINRIRIGGEVTLDEVTGFISTEPKQDVEPVNVARVEMMCFGSQITILKEVIGHPGRPSYLNRSLKAKNER